MKNLLYTLSVILLVGITSCSEEDFTTFDGVKSGIYIQAVAMTDINGNPKQYSDSTTFSFSSYAEDVQTATIRVPICIMGNVKDYDRPFLLKVDESTTTAVRGVHFDYDESTCVIPAGGSKVNVNVTLYRHPDLVSQTLRVNMRLESNDEFTVELEQYKNTVEWNAVGKELCGHVYKIKFNDTYSVTSWWQFMANPIFGEWTASKEKRINAIMGWTHLDWVNWNVPYGRMGFAAKMLKKELQELADAGTPVIDDDGSYMQLPAPYEVDYSAYE